MGQTVIVENGLTLFDNNDPTFSFANLGTGSIGNVVEVKGDDLVGNALMAVDVEIKDSGLGDHIDKVEVEGFVANLNTVTRTFTLNGQTVSYAGATLLGGNIDDLVANAKIEAEGPIVGGILQAVKIGFED